MLMFREYIRNNIFVVTMLTTLLSACSFSEKSCKRMLTIASNKTYDVIVVPGIPFENGSWDLTMKGRVYWSKYLYDKGIAKNIMYSGAAVYSPYCEAEIMALYAEALGIPRENIYTETFAEHSTENIYYSNKKAKKLGFKTVALASDPFQSKMLKSFIEKRVDPTIDIIPFVYDTLKMMNAEMKDPIIDYQKAFKKDFISIKQRESFSKRLKGTRGKDLDQSLYE